MEAGSWRLERGGEVCGPGENGRLLNLPPGLLSKWKYKWYGDVPADFIILVQEYRQEPQSDLTPHLDPIGLAGFPRAFSSETASS